MAQAGFRRWPFDRRTVADAVDNEVELDSAARRRNDSTLNHMLPILTSERAGSLSLRTRPLAIVFANAL